MYIYIQIHVGICVHVQCLCIHVQYNCYMYSVPIALILQANQLNLVNEDLYVHESKDITGLLVKG